MTLRLCKNIFNKFWRRKMWNHISDRQCLSISDRYMHTHSQGLSMNLQAALMGKSHYNSNCSATLQNPVHKAVK